MMNSDTQTNDKADDLEGGNESHDNENTVPTRRGSDDSLHEKLNSNQTNRNGTVRETVENNNANEIIQLKIQCKAMIRYIGQLKKEETQYYHQNEILAREAILNGYQPHIVQEGTKASTGLAQSTSNIGTSSKKRSRTSSTSLGNVGPKNGRTSENKNSKNSSPKTSSPVKVQSAG